MTVRYSPALAHHGFDRSAAPDWQMVPVGGTRILNVSGVRGLVPRVRNPDPANPALTMAVSGAGSTVRLTLTGGPVAGLASVEWVPSGGLIGAVATDHTLEVSVKAEKRVQIAFHYVDDGRRQQTRRKIDDLDAMITRANRILTPQANVTLVRKSAAALPVAQNLGRVVRFSSHLEGPPHNVDPAQHEWDDLFALRDTTADFNVFFVREYEDDITPLRDDTDAGTLASDKMCVFEDRITDPAGATLAHEMVHGLGVPDHDISVTHLMADGEHGIGRFITKDQANTINPSGT
jgi:hypothetical protein